MHRTTTDWSALCLAELRGQEPHGTVGRLLAEATGRKVTATTSTPITVPGFASSALTEPSGVIGYRVACFGYSPVCRGHVDRERTEF
jgi:hypothetical protein